jgi:hypothetical protein
MRKPTLVKTLMALAALLAATGLLRATIFSALPSMREQALRKAEERLGVTKSVDTAFGLARVAEAKTPPEVAVGEMRCLWKGLWQLSGGKIDINRALATELRMDRASSEVCFKVRWTAGNEAVSRSAGNRFVMKVIRVDGGSETVIETVTKEVKVGGKGLGKTAFKNGDLRSKRIAIAAGAEFKIVLQARNANTGASLETSTVVEFKR